MVVLLLELELALEMVSEDFCRPYVFGGILPMLSVLRDEQEGLSMEGKDGQVKSVA